MKKLLLLSLTYVALWAVWYFAYPYFLIWLEGFSFFTTLPDFTAIHFHLPEDTFRYVGSFLLQFYAFPAAGAAIQALLPVLFILSIMAIIKRLVENSEGLVWIAYAFLPLYLYYQMSDMTLVRSITILAVTAAAALLIWLVTIFVKPALRMPAFLRNRYVSIVLLLVSIGASASVMTTYGSVGRHYEKVAHMYHLAQNQEWEKILEEISVQESVQNEYMRKYALLALAQTGQLTDYAFRYGLSSSDDFLFYDVQESFCLSFNVLFYRSLGMNNPAVYHSYQQALQSVPGLSFDVMRNLTDIYLEQKEYELAKKYMDILKHTTCHGKWVKERLPKLEAIRDAEPEYRMEGDKFIMEAFLPDISSMYDRYPKDARYADYLLCAVLANKDASTFFKIFNVVAPRIYAGGQGIPRMYQEALLLIASKEPTVLKVYKIDEDVWKRFTDFTELMSTGKTAQAKRKYADSYWAYVY
ncbi:MAG: hypothetical protein IKU36_09985 [Bacteroidales bacterium]|nr:hypothetical protein [Bacteroidales bacterium]